MNSIGKYLNQKRLHLANPRRMNARLALHMNCMSRSWDDIDDHDADTCDGHEHKIAYTKARIEYQKEIPNGFNVYAVDMHRVILLPKLSTKESFFVSRLIVFNETFAQMGADHEPDYVLLWHEGKSGRLAQDVASVYIK